MAYETNKPEKSFNQPVEDRLFMPVEEYNIYSWSPEPPGTKNVKATQVHVHVNFQIEKVKGTFIMRIKTEEAINELIEALKIHREDVWPTNHGHHET